MKTIRLIIIALCFGLLPSCALIGSILKIPVSLIKSVGRTAGIGNLTDDAPQPVNEEATKTIEEAASERDASSE